MTTPAPAPASTTPPPAAARTPAPPLTLEERLALTGAAMTARLAEAAVAYEVNTAHLAVDPVHLADVVTTVPLTPHLAPRPDRTPVAGLLYATHQRLVSGGWCKGAYTDTDGAHCILGALRAESGGNHRLEQHAIDVLMDVIRAEFGDAVDTIPSFNDAWAHPRTPLRLVDTAARRADARGL
ncbi:hypothetical protein ACIBL6_47640 [Streptomyces sp. NPDC050400]|uniref:DUF6197 family protein n=1 Tax=Streptomyces sp. NPDC050400 TaxID=3365610 RepID=UPI0037B752AE